MAESRRCFILPKVVRQLARHDRAKMVGSSGEDLMNDSLRLAKLDLSAVYAVSGAVISWVMSGKLIE